MTEQGIHPVAIQRASIRGIEDLREAVKGGELSATQLQQGPLNGALIHAAIGQSRISIGEFSQGIRVRGYLSQNAVTLGMLLSAEAEVLQWNKDTRAGDVVTFPDGGEEDGCFLGASSYMTITLPVNTLLRTAASHETLASESLWLKPAVYSPSPAIKAAVRHRINVCRSMLDRHGSELSANAARLIEAELLNCYLTSMSELHAFEGDVLRRDSLQIIRATEDILAEMDPVPVDVHQLCNKLQVGRRTLHRAFKSVLAIGPIAYLRLNRLALARCRLSDASPAATSVTRIALDHGFWELGRFSVVYRKLFGELPSTTLEREPPTTLQFERHHQLSTALTQCRLSEGI